MTARRFTAVRFPFLVAPALLLAIVAFAAPRPDGKGSAPASVAPPPPASSAAAPPRRKPIDPAAPAEKEFANIQVLKGIPAGELHPAMEYIEASLGVGCGNCHVRGGFEKDDKPEKGIARKMIQMVDRINRESFDGRRVVSCFTCHQGRKKPVALPSLAAASHADAEPELLPAEPGARIPSPTELFDRYAKELGGRELLGRLATRRAKLSQPSEEGGPTTIELLGKGPASWLATMASEREGKVRKVTYGSNGKSSWRRQPDGQTAELGTGDREELFRLAELVPATDPAAFAEPTVLGRAKLGDGFAWVVRARGHGGLDERLWFETGRGLLVRREYRVPTPLGALPVRVDYSDWKPADGVKVPRTVRWSQAGGEGWTDTIVELDLGLGIDDDRFEKP